MHVACNAYNVANVGIAYTLPPSPCFHASCCNYHVLYMLRMSLTLYSILAWGFGGFKIKEHIYK